MATGSDTQAGLGLYDLRGTGAWSQGLLCAQAAICALAVTIALLAGPGFMDEASGSMPYALVSLGQAVIFIAGAIVFLRWTYCASANVHRIGAQGLGPSPGWAVGWYFVPIACLGMPFVAMKEIWKASIEPRDWEIVKSTPLLGWWWTFWIFSNLTGLVAFRLEAEETSTEVMSYVETLTIVSDGTFVPASLLLAAIVGRITVRQSVYLPGE
jgi:hypothetical protein